ncbi:MAG TPA: protein-glutamate O-methyltransferase CheR [Polyangiales bacterium]|nr:protein-glutamate O-methyltransferase CheR [Polyangiales bacterium]
MQAEEVEIRALLESIHARYGYDLRDYAPDSMRRRVLACLSKSGLPHLGELQHQLLHRPELFSQVLDDLTVRVSDMFRNPELYRLFRERVVPILRSYPLLRIWLAGCASGEEAYSCAILLSEEQLYDRAQIYATDLSSHALEQAKLGVYRADRLRGFRENYQRAGGRSQFERYCTLAYEHLAMAESLRRNIVFFQHDLTHDQVFGEMHVIFCRNVMIYFGQPLRERVLEKFEQSLCSGGFLCLGDSEQLARATRARSFAEFALPERVYRRRAA